MALAPLSFIYEDNHLLAVQKPAGLPTMGAAAGADSVVSLAKAYIKQKYDKPGNVYLGVVSRLDAVATGVVLLARTSKAAARLTELFRTGQVAKHYWAIVAGQPKPRGDCVDWLRKNEALRKMEVVEPDTDGAREARLSYRRLSQRASTAVLEVDLKTGRKHQIRVQLASRGHPILGDRKYDSQRTFPTGIALHARRLELIHPVRKTPLELVSPLPDTWRQFGVAGEITGD